MIGSLRYRGHDFYVPWFRALSPGVRDFVFDADGGHRGTQHGRHRAGG